MRKYCSEHLSEMSEHILKEEELVENKGEVATINLRHCRCRHTHAVSGEKEGVLCEAWGQHQKQILCLSFMYTQITLYI